MAERYPIKAKSLTLLELCQSIHDFRNPSSRNTAQILTRRLYLHPLTINSNAKVHPSKFTSHTSLDLTQTGTSHHSKKKSSHKRRSHRDLTIQSSSVPLVNRANTKLNVSGTTTDEDSTNDFEVSRTTFSSNQVSLPPILTRRTPSSSKGTISTRPAKIFHQKKIKPIRLPPEKVDVWGQLAYALRRPIPQDPPTTPFYETYDSPLDDIPSEPPEEEEEEPRLVTPIPVVRLFKRTQRQRSMSDDN